MRKLQFFFALVLLFGSVAVKAVEKVKLPAKEKFYLVLLIGQSNMAGRGFVDAKDNAPHPRVLMLSKSGEWVPAIDPVHYDKKTAGVGPGRTFANLLAESDPSITVGLIPAACGGSSLTVWKPGAYFKGTKTHPYDDALSRARRAMQDGTLKVILFHQGESDCSAKKCGEYYNRLNTLISSLRKELNAEDVPLVIGQLSRWSKWTEYRKQVNAAHLRLVKEASPAAFATSENLTHNPDKIHFDTPSQREFGRRYFEAYQSISKK